MIPVSKFTYRMHRWQKRVFRKFDLGIRFFFFFWHRRARKTTCAVNLLIRECCKHPKSSYVYVAPTYKQAKQIVWDDPNMLKSYLPDKADMSWKLNEQEMSVKFSNGSILRIRGADNPDSLRGIDAVGVVFDEWALIQLAAWQEIFRPIIGQSKDRWAMFLFTPKGVNHATEMCDFAKDGENPEWCGETLRASLSDLIPREELEKMRKEMPPTLYDQEMECSRITSEERSVITSSMLERLKTVTFTEDGVRKLISCDPSAGGDECAIKVFYNTEVVEAMELHEDNTMIVAGQLKTLGIIHGTDNYIIDTIGLGKGIVDNLILDEKCVQAFNSSHQAFDTELYVNRKSEMWFYVADQVRRLKTVYPDDYITRKQLIAVKYKPVESNGKIIIIPKTETKKLIGCSPDRADAWVMGIYGLQNVELDQNTDEDYGVFIANETMMDPMCL